MTYDDILSVVKEKMCQVLDDLDINTIDPQKSMADYDADSLEIVEIVSRTIKQLHIKAPRTEIASVKNIDGFVNVLLKYSQSVSNDQ